jgi:hypothetical protein
MIRALTYRIESQKVITTLNVIYSMFFAVLARFAFQQEINPSTRSVSGIHCLVDAQNLLPVVFLASYFLLDWLTTNITAALKDGMNHLVFVALIIIVAYLGVLVALSFAVTIQFYFLVSTYACVVPWWDLMKPSMYRLESQVLFRSLVVYGIVILRLVVGISMLLTVVLSWWLNSTEALTNIRPIMFIGLFLYLILKLIRYFAYVQFDTPHI